MIGFDQLKYWLVSINIDLEWLILIWIGLDRSILVWISYYRSRWINYLKVFVNVGKDWLISVKMLVEA